MENNHLHSRKFTSSQLIKYALNAEEGFGHWHEEIGRILGNVEMAVPESLKAVDLERREKQRMACLLRNFSQENLIMLLLSIGNEVSNGKIVEIEGLVLADYEVRIATREGKISSVESRIHTLTRDRENSFRVIPPGAAIHYQTVRDRNPLRDTPPDIIIDSIRAFIPQIEDYAERATDSKIKIIYKYSIVEKNALGL